MKIFLAGFESHKKMFFKIKPKYILESFYYIRSDDFVKYRDSTAVEVLLDSGAFTYLNSGKKVDFDKYVEKYAKYIYDNKIALYFEMDIDGLVGLKKVEEYRKFLEKETKTRTIPVWHKSRGFEDFVKTSIDYKYMAMGFADDQSVIKKIIPYLNKFLKIAHQNDCRVHGLGFTKTRILRKIKFDTVDSTSWNRGRFGELCMFKNGKIEYIQERERKMKNQKLAAEHNLKEWKKYQLYMERIRC